MLALSFLFSTFASSSSGKKEEAMASAMSSVFFLILLLSTTVFASSSSLHADISNLNGESESVMRRSLLSFKENPRGSNVTFECSPSGPCVPCLYSEKNNKKYHCSETGYRIPFKCKEIADGLQSSNEQTILNRSTLEAANPELTLHNTELTPVIEEDRSLLDDSTASKHKPQAYITYRSCVPASSDEKLSVLGFEGIVLGLILLSGTFIYVRRRRTVPMPGVALGRMPTSSRF